MSVAWTTIVSVGVAVLKYIKDNIAHGEMNDFRHKREGADKWIKGNIFKAEDEVLIINIGGLGKGLMGIIKKVQSALDDD